MKTAQGFTLLEMLVAVTVFSLIMVAAVSGMRTMAQINTRIVATADRLDEMRSVSHVLRTMLESPHGGAGGASQGGTWAGRQRMLSSYFRGAPSRLEWLAPVTGVAGISGLHYLRLRVAGDQLVLDLAPHRQMQAEPDWNQRVASHVIVQSLDGFEAAYRDARDSTWKGDFDPESVSVPQAIRLRLRVKERFWPDLIVAPVTHTAGSPAS